MCTLLPVESARGNTWEKVPSNSEEGTVDTNRKLRIKLGGWATIKGEVRGCGYEAIEIQIIDQVEHGDDMVMTKGLLSVNYTGRVNSDVL